jgi:hypothetical protein
VTVARHTTALRKLAQRTPLERFRFVYQRLTLRGGFTLQEISDRFELCLKSAQRDVDFMRDRLGYELTYNHEERRWVGQPPAERIL